MAQLTFHPADAATAASPAGTGTLPTMRAYGDTFSGTVANRWLVLAGFAPLSALAHGVGAPPSVPARRTRAAPGA
jgi:hypothetical protein